MNLQKRPVGGSRFKMKSWNILNSVKRFKPSRPGRILVFETTGFGLYGLSASCGLNSNLKLGTPVHSSSVDPVTAIGEILDEIKTQTRWGLPGTAVLITPSVSPDLLLLPVPPGKPRPVDQMREMVRWELEELFVGQNDIWSLGALLQGRGLISSEERRQAESIPLQERQARSPAAVYESLVSKDRINECLVIQEQLSTLDDDLALGWSPQGGKDANKDGDEPFPWAAAGVGTGIRDLWVKAFRKHGIRCTFIYPQLGAAMPLLEPGEEDWIYLDIRQEQYAVFQGKAVYLESLSVNPCSSGQPDYSQLEEHFTRMLKPETRMVYWSMPEGLTHDMTGLLERIAGERDFSLVFIPSNSEIPDSGSQESLHETICPASIRASLEGVARHALNQGRGISLVRIQAQEPAPPVWKNRELVLWTLIGMCVLSVTAYDVYLRRQTKANNWQLELLEIEYDNRMKMKREAQKTDSEVKRLESVLDEKQQELKEIERKKEILDRVIRYRQDLIPGVLEAVGGSVTDEVVLERLEENQDRSGFYLEAWTLSDTVGQKFGDRLNKAMGTWNYKVGELQLDRSRGRLGMDGYLLKIRLIRKNENREAHDA